MNGAFVFRFPRRQIAAPLIEQELRVLPLLPELPLPIPRVEFRGAPSASFPGPLQDIAPWPE